MTSFELGQAVGTVLFGIPLWVLITLGIAWLLDRVLQYVLKGKALAIVSYLPFALLFFLGSLVAFSADTRQPQSFGERLTGFLGALIWLVVIPLGLYIRIRRVNRQQAQHG